MSLKIQNFSLRNFSLFVTSAVCTYFTILFNWNIVAPLLPICKKWLPIFPLPCLTPKWFITIVGGQFHSHLTTYLVVIPNFFFSFHRTLRLGHWAWLLHFFMLRLSSCRKQRDSEAMFYLIFRVYSPLFCSNRRYKFCASTQLPLSSCLQRKTVAFVES